MVLTSINYLTFLFIAIVIYYLLPKRLNWFLLLVFTGFFIYSATSEIKFYFYILYSVLISFFGALIISKLKTEKGKKIAQTVTIFLMFIMLFFLKYLIPVSESLRMNLDISIIAPIGITFYSLIAMGYVIDVGRGVSIPQKNILKYTLFVLYFPALTSGPFTRYNDMEETLYIKHDFDFKNILFGCQRILWGIFKKLVIAERLAVMVNTVYSNYVTYNGVYIVIATIAFAIELYADFSGCMDIIMGSSQCFGVKLPENFDTPYFSKTISEFWRRWHITLGAWFKDYLFYPILKSDIFQKMQTKCKEVFSKKWGKRIPTYLGMFILWFTVGAWHGGALKYIIGVGLLHWFYIVSGEICKPIFDKLEALLKINREHFVFKLWQMIRTFILVCIGFVFFRAPSVSSALEMLKLSFVNNYKEILNLATFVNLGLTSKDLAVTLISLILLFVTSVLKQKYPSLREEITKQHIVVRYAIWLTLIMVILVFGYYGTEYDASAFIYQNF